MGVLQTKPTRAGFLAFLRDVVGIPPNALSDTSVQIDYAYEVALLIVNLKIACAIPQLYVLAVYNLGADNLITWAQDKPPSTYFTDLRASFGTNQFTGGVVASTYDEGTGTSLQIIEALKDLSIGQLQNLKTPYGLAYLDIASKVGTDWGIS